MGKSNSVPRKFFRQLPAMIVGLAICLVFSAYPLVQASDSPDRKFYVTDGTVNAIAQIGSALYIGGDFAYIGPNTGHGAGINTSSALPSTLDPHIGGDGSSGVYAVVSDGDGGWYVGGQFSRIGDTDVNNLAHINKNKVITTAFNPDPDGIVRALAVSADNSLLYVGGDFANIGGQTRNRLAAVSTTDGAATNWNPNADSTVWAMILDPANDRLFVGGSFSTLGADAAARGIAAFDLTSDAPVAGWAAAAAVNAGGSVRSFALNSDGSVLYAGGSFSAIGGQLRNQTAAITVADGSATSWNPNADGTVHALSVTGDDAQVYAAGEFGNIGGASRTRIARLDAILGAADTQWNHSANNTVSTLVLAEDLNRIHLGGDFTDIDGTETAYNAALPIGETAVTWTLRSTGPVRAMSRPGDDATMFVGGQFSSIGGVVRNKAAALNASTGSPLAWAPKIDDGAVESLTLGYDNTEVYLGGSFTSVDSQPRNRLVKVDANSGALFDWAPDIDSGTVRSVAISTDGAQVLALAVSPADGSIVLAGTEEGLFRSTDAGATWAQIDLNGSAVISDIAFDPNTPSRVFVASRGRGVFGSGDSGATWQEDNSGLTTLQATSIAFSSDSSRIYIGTKFLNSDIGGLYKRDAGASGWTFARNTDVDTLAVEPSDKNYVYIGNSIGLFVTDDGGPTLFRADQGLKDKTVRHIISSNYTDPGTNNRVIYTVAASAIYRSRDKGVNWENFGRGLPGAALYKIALHPSDDDILFLASFGRGIYRTLNATNPSIGSVVFRPQNTDLESQYTYTVAVDPNDADTLYSGASLGRLFKTTNGAASWSAAETGIPHNILYVGGDFSGSHPDYLAALNTVGTSDYFVNWDPQPTATVNTLKISADGANLYVGGEFTTIGGQPRQRLAALTRTTGTATSWAPSIDDGIVNAIALTTSENAIYVGGSFTSANTTTRNRLALIDTSTAELKPWNPGANGDVNALVLGTNDATIVVAGSFTNISGQARNYLASLLTEDSAGAATQWNPNPNAPILGRNTLARITSTIFVGGSFSRIGNMVTRSFAGYSFTVPITSASPRGSAFPDPQDVTLTCSNSSGTACNTIYYTTDTDLDNATWQLYPGSAMTISSSVELSFYGVDDEGSRSATQSETYRIDATAPALTATPTSGTYKYTQTVELICDDGDGGSGTDIGVAGCDTIFFTTDGSQPTFSYSRPQETGNLEFEPGTGTLLYARPIPVVIDSKLRFIAVDRAGNTSSEGSASYSIVRVPAGSLAPAALIALIASCAIRARRRASPHAYRPRR